MYNSVIKIKENYRQNMPEIIERFFLGGLVYFVAIFWALELLRYGLFDIYVLRNRKTPEEILELLSRLEINQRRLFENFLKFPELTPEQRLKKLEKVSYVTGVGGILIPIFPIYVGIRVFTRDLIWWDGWIDTIGGYFSWGFWALVAFLSIGKALFFMRDLKKLDENQNIMYEHRN